MEWSRITDIILAAALLLVGVFGALGACQWYKRKSLKKVDRELLAFVPSLVVMVGVYLFFDKILVLNTRPDGSGEPSFPSSHAMIVATIFLCTALALPKYIKSRPLRITLDVIMLILVAVTAAGRVLANKHWASDVVAGLVFAVVFGVVYYLIVRKGRKEQNE